MKMYQVDSAGYFTGAVADVDEALGVPDGWVLTEPPKLKAGEFAKWTGIWLVTIDRPAQDTAAITRQYEQAVQAKLDAAAVAARYDSIATAVSYAEEPAVPKFQADGIAFRAWRSLVWAYAYEQLAKVLAGEREQPTIEAFLLELPELVLPA
jgi:hypothetical protein